LLGMYIAQARKRVVEKEKTGNAQLAAHRQLGEKYRELERLSEDLKTMDPRHDRYKWKANRPTCPVTRIVVSSRFHCG